jgi:hypothetical protein
MNCLFINIRMLFNQFLCSICSYRHHQCLANSQNQYWICHYAYGDQYLCWWVQYIPYQGAGYQFLHISTKTSTYWVKKRRYTPCNGCQYQLEAHTSIGIWIFSPVMVSHLYGVNTIEMVVVGIPNKCFEVQDARPVKGQYHVNATAIWKSIPGELNGNVLKFLSTKELVGLKSVCKIAKSAIKSEKGLLFDAIRECLDKIIEKCGFESVPKAFKFKVKNCVLLGGALGLPVMLSIPPKDACKLFMMKTCLRWEPTLKLVGT